MIGMNLEKTFVSGIVYVHNHAPYLDQMIQGLSRIFMDNFEKSEIVFVDDCSTDASINIIREKCRMMDNISVSIIHLSFMQGLESGMMAGMDMAIGDFVFEFDSPIVDYEFEEVMRVYHKALSGYDVVSASPNVAENLTSRAFYKLFRRYSKNKVQLNTESFRLISRRGINRINMLTHVNPYRKALYFNCGLKAINLKYEPSDQSIVAAKRNNLRNDSRLRLALDSLLLFTEVGEKVAFYMSLSMIAITFLILGYTLFVYFVRAHVIEGWTTLMLVMSISFAGLFSMLAILIKYVSLVLSIQCNKQKYIFEAVEKIK